ncbi:MAG: hypothetical protein ACQEXG_14785 [Pseudomonadota bacterium]
MTDIPDTFADARGDPADGPIASAIRNALVIQLEDYEHLLFEPMTQADLDGLYELYGQWQAVLGDSPEAIALCDALYDFIGAGIEDGGGGGDSVERAYLALVATVQEGGA